jgi:next to BRCA1 gene 1 protein
MKANSLQTIVGVRHKCLACPDWDYCTECASKSSLTHPGHRFARLYESLGYIGSRKPVHRGIYCDGPLCTANKTYIKGDRYKCAVCHDTDFCANCEALPNNVHNATHPLIKMKVPIRHVSVQSIHQSDDGHDISELGDRKHASTETTRTSSTNAATQVQTVAEVKPAEQASAASTPKVKQADKVGSNELQAWYESDSTPDGSSFAPNRLVSQSWTLRNPGPEAWPAGCAVHFIGGDDMRNLDIFNPSSVTDMVVANRSNVLKNSLQPGKTAVFTVLLKSPQREGRAISYWRLKTPEGLPFGHKLWVDINVKTPVVELPIRSAPITAPPAPTVVDAPEEEEKPVIAQEAAKSQEGSTMIFPKLEKESPVSSVHNVSETAVPAPSSEIASKADEQDLLDDVESLELEDDSDDEGFLTDEEYDILDASDEDFLLEAQNAVAKK